MKDNHRNSIASIFLHWAIMIIPEARKSWTQAMISEFNSIPPESSRLEFAFGCLMAAVSELAKTRWALAWIGRLFVFIGLIAMSAGGAFIIWGHAQQEVTGLLLFLCLIYALGALVTLLSLRALRYYSGTGLCVAVLAGTWFTITSSPLIGLSCSYLALLCFEAGIVMGILFIAAVYLSLVNSDDVNALNHA